MPWTGTTFSCRKCPNCGVCTQRPLSAFNAIDDPPRSEDDVSSPVKYQGVPPIVARVEEQNCSKFSRPVIGYVAASTLPSLSSVRWETRACEGSSSPKPSSWLTNTSTVESELRYAPIPSGIPLI